MSDDFLTLKLTLPLKKQPKKELTFVIDEIEKTFDSYGLLTAKNGRGGVAYDGYGYDKKRKQLEFFWFLENIPPGKSQYTKLSSKLDVVESLIKAWIK